MKKTETFIGAFTLFFVAMSAVFFTSVPPAEAEAGDLSWKGDVRFRYEQDTDDFEDEDRSREKIRLRLGGSYKPNDNVLVGFRLSTGSTSIQSPDQTLEGGDASDNSDFGLDRAYLAIKGGSSTVLLGKWGAPLFNPAQFLYDVDFSFEGIGIAVGSGSTKIVLAHTIITENGWSGATGDDTLLTAQIQAGGGEGASWKAAFGLNQVSLKSGVTDTENSVYHFVAQIRAKGLNDIRIGGGYSWHEGDTDYDSSDGTGSLIYIRSNSGPLGIGLYYWDVGVGSQILEGAVGQDSSPFTSNFRGYHVQVVLPKLHNEVSWDVRYYYQETKNGDLSRDAGYIMTGDGRKRDRIQINFKAQFKG